MAAEHWIGRLRFEVDAPDQRAFDPVRDALRSRFDTLVMPGLQAALDEVDPGGATLHFERLEIDLGTMTAAEAGLDLLARRIGDGLAAALRGRAAPGPPDAATAGPEPEPRLEALLAHFLRSGTIPWPEPGRALAALAEALAMLGEAEFMGLARRTRHLLARPEGAGRLARQLPAPVLRRFALALAPAAERRELAARLTAKTAELYLDEAEAATWTTRLSALARGEAPRTRQPRRRRAGRPAAEEITPEAEAATTAPAAPEERGPEEDRPPILADPAPAERVPDPAQAAASAESEPEAVLLPVAAAGTVLLHPFLANFFRRLGLTGEDDAFVDSPARRRAVLLVHYLATGLPEAPEPDLPLAKLLCGMDFAEPVPRRLEPTDKERGEAQALLVTIVRHWAKLGDSSPAALRETFLVRPGRLERQSKGWKLRVEARGVDLLLDSLPWTISIVKTPFMAETLKVDWR